MEYTILPELSELIAYTRDITARKYGMDVVDVAPFMLASLECEACTINSVLREIMISDDFDRMKEELSTLLEEQRGEGATDDIEFDAKFDAIMKSAAASGSVPCSSVSFWIHMLQLSSYANKIASRYGITKEQISAVSNNSEQQDVKETDEKITHKRRLDTKNMVSNSYVENMLTNVNTQAERGEVSQVFGNNAVINRIFTTWARHERNNVVLVGESGIGKTSTVRHIANLIVNGDVPSFLRKRKLIQFKLSDIMPSSGIKGVFEEQYKSIVGEAHARDCYIFFIDDVKSALSEDAHYSDMGIEAIMDKMLSDRNIPFITTATPKEYSSLIEANPFMRRRFCRIDIEEKTIDECIDVVDSTKKTLEDFHNVKYSRDLITLCTKEVKQRLIGCVLPDTVYDILDEVGACYSVTETESPDIERLKAEVAKLRGMRMEMIDNPSEYTREDTDEIDRKYTAAMSQLSCAEKNEALQSRYHEITKEELMGVIMQRCGKSPMRSLSTMGEVSLLEANLKKKVIGQDDAVHKVSRVVKRKIAGLAKQKSPSVMMFIGTTGTGKTHLAKKLAEELFGSESSMVRLDMSEYGDKMSVNKLYGSSPGYVGYEKGGQLTEAVKKKKQCVLLLDEIEKAADEVHDVLLQVFDDGRLTDNKGVTVDFSDTIIIMTSNVGASEADERGGGIGFSHNSDFSESVFKNAVRRKFKPEFLNRVDEIVMFNKLTTDNIRSIADLEVGFAEKQILEAGCEISADFHNNAVERVMHSMSDGKYGARPVRRAVQNIIDDVADAIIENGGTDGLVATC